MKIAEPVFSTSRGGARSAYHDKYPRDFGPQIAYTESLALDTSRPRSCREGENCRPLGAMRQIPFIRPTLCRSHARFNFYIYIEKCSSYFLHMVFTFCFDAYLSFTRSIRTRVSACPMANAHGIDRAVKRLRMRAVDSFWCVFDSLINESVLP